MQGGLCRRGTPQRRATRSPVVTKAQVCVTQRAGAGWHRCKNGRRGLWSRLSAGWLARRFPGCDDERQTTACHKDG